MSQLSVEVEQHVQADADVVWSLVANANTYPQWGPWTDGGYRPPSAGPSAKGMVQWFRYDRRTTTVEEILEADPPRRLVYAVVRGMPVKHYRAEVTLTAGASGGTVVRWAATWDTTVMGRLVRPRLQRVYLQVLTALATTADGQVTSSPPL